MPSILTFERSPLEARLIREALEPAGFTIIEAIIGDHATDGQAAELAARVNPTLVTTSWRRVGPLVVPALKRAIPKVPIIVITDDPSAWSSAMSYGGVRLVIEKTFRAERLRMIAGIFTS